MSTDFDYYTCQFRFASMSFVTVLPAKGLSRLRLPLPVYATPVCAGIEPSGTGSLSEQSPVEGLLPFRCYRYLIGLWMPRIEDPVPRLRSDRGRNTE